MSRMKLHIDQFEIRAEIRVLFGEALISLNGV